MNFIFQLRRGSTAEWAASTRALLAGEPGLDMDLGILKMGDGVSLWAALPVTGADNASVAGFITEDGETKDALNATIGVVVNEAAARFDPRDFGAKVDGKVITDAGMTSGSAVLSSASHSFTAADIGKAIGVVGAGTVSGNYTTNANDGKLVSTILSVASGNATLANVAVNTVAGATAVFGTPDDDAIEDAQDAASAAGGGTLYIPAGRMIVTRPLALKSYVEWAGAGRDISWVDVIFSAPNTGGGTLEWLHSGAAGREIGLHFHDWAIEAQFHIRPSGYATSLKPLNVYGIDRCSIERMQLRNFPATAIPFDSPRDGVYIANNLIVNPGRLFDGTAGGSGIGIGVSKDGNPSSCVVIGNTIIGVGSPTTSPAGNNGIFIENQDGTGAPTFGFRIIGNYVQGMTHGIAENGAGHTIIADNVVVNCYEGITVSRTILTGAYAGEDTIIHHNAILGWAPGSSVSKGILVNISRAAGTDYGNARVLHNTITDRTGRGIVLVGATSNPTGIEVRGNRVRKTTLTGIHLSVTSVSFVNLIIADNDVDTVGTAATASDNNGIRLAGAVSHLTLTGNRVVASNGSGLAITAAMSGGGQITNNDVGSFGLSGTIESSIRVADNNGIQAPDDTAVVLVRATDMVDVSGTSTPGNLTRYPYLSLPDAASTFVGALIPIPSGWTTFSIQVLWTAATGSSGNVVLRADVTTVSAADLISAVPNAGSGVTIAAPATQIITANNIRTGIATGGKQFAMVNVGRLGSDAADTTTNPVLLLGVNLIRTA